MPVNAPPLGTQILSGTGDWYTLSSGSNNQIAILLPQPSDSLFLHRLGAWMRQNSSSPRVQFAVWEQNPSTLLPGKLLGYTKGLLVANTAATYEAPLTWSSVDADTGVAGSGIRLPSGASVFIGAKVLGGAVDIAIPAGAVAQTIYRKTTSGNPTDPFANSGTQNVKAPAFYAIGEIDELPVVAITGPATTVSTAAPTLSATITDPNSGAPGQDRLRWYQLEVRAQATTALVWTYESLATPAERAAAAFSVPYNGPALSQITYEWRARAQDDVLTLGDWSAWSAFTVTNLGGIDVSNAGPTGKLESGIVTTWTARWTHPVPRNAQAAELRVLSDGLVVRTSPTITLSPTVGNNAFITISGTTAVVATAANPLPSGTYTWQMRAQDTAGNWSPWSSDVALSVNFPPNQPSDLRPVSGSTAAARPLLDWLLSDPDLDDVLGGDLISEWEITRPDTSIVTGTTNAVDPATGRGTYQVQATDAPVNGTYQWRVRGRDQSAVSAGTGIGPWSAPALFTIITAPVVAITQPLANAVISTSTPQIAWTVSDGTQVFFRIQLYRAGETTAFYSTGQIPIAASTSGTFVIPGGWLKNGLVYDADVTIWTAGGIVSTSPRLRFSVSYPAADTLGAVQAALLANRRDFEATSVVVSWGRTNYPQSQFQGYIVWRRPSHDDPDTALPVALILQPGQTTYIDHHPPPNVPLIYGVTQLRKSGADVQSSAIVEVQTEVPMTTPVLASVLSGGDVRLAIAWLSTGLSYGFASDDATVKTWGNAGAPSYLRTPEGWGQDSASLSFTLKTDSRGELHEHVDDLKALVKSGHPLCLRTETDRIFCRIRRGGQYLRRGGVGTMEASLEVEEIAWNEAIAIAT